MTDGLPFTNNDYEPWLEGMKVLVKTPRACHACGWVDADGSEAAGLPSTPFVAMEKGG